MGYRAKLELVMRPDGSIVTKIPGSPVDIPLITLVRALDLEADKDIADSVSLNEIIQDELEPSFEKAGDVKTSRDAIVYISKRIAPGMLEEFQIKRAETLLDWGLLPHIGKNPDNRHEKALFLGEAASKLIELKMGWIDSDDKDHYGNQGDKVRRQMLADLLGPLPQSDPRHEVPTGALGPKRGINAVAAAVRPGIVLTAEQRHCNRQLGRGRVGVTQIATGQLMSTHFTLAQDTVAAQQEQPNFEARTCTRRTLDAFAQQKPLKAHCGLSRTLHFRDNPVNAPSAEVPKALRACVQNVEDAGEDFRGWPRGCLSTGG